MARDIFVEKLMFLKCSIGLFPVLTFKHGKRKWTTHVHLGVFVCLGGLEWKHFSLELVVCSGRCPYMVQHAMASGHHFYERQNLPCFDCVLFEFQLTFRSIDSDWLAGHEISNGLESFISYDDGFQLNQFAFVFLFHFCCKTIFKQFGLRQFTWNRFSLSVSLASTTWIIQSFGEKPLM